MKPLQLSDKLVEETISALRRNNFEVWLVKDSAEAADVFINDMLQAINPKVVSWGDSMTLKETGILEKIRDRQDITLIEPFATGLSRHKIIQNRKLALSADLFLTGTNAITAKGQLVNLDMVGNRVAGITFGPRHVVLFVSISKIVDDLDAAFQRIRTHAAPLNAGRHPELQTPCAVTGRCMDCSSPGRICNTWTITEKSYPKGRTKIVLLEETYGL